MTMLIAGHETTAAVLTWTMYCLTKHPEYISQIQAEVSSFPHVLLVSKQVPASSVISMLMNAGPQLDQVGKVRLIAEDYFT